MRKTLRALYRDYETRAAMTAKLQRDRRGIPVLDQLLTETRDRDLRELGTALLARLGERRDTELKALISLALDFFTFETLTRAGLDAETAATLISDLVLNHATRRSRFRI